MVSPRPSVGGLSFPEYVIYRGEQVRIMANMYYDVLAWWILGYPASRKERVGFSFIFVSNSEKSGYRRSEQMYRPVSQYITNFSQNTRHNVCTNLLQIPIVSVMRIFPRIVYCKNCVSETMVQLLETLF